MEPSESTTISCGMIGEHDIEGISDGFVPGIYANHREIVDSVYPVTSQQALTTMRELARDYGLLVGPSSGGHLEAARHVRDTYPELKTIVTLFCDEGEKYINDHFSQTTSGMPTETESVASTY